MSVRKLGLLLFFFVVQGCGKDITVSTGNTSSPATTEGDGSSSSDTEAPTISSLVRSDSLPDGGLTSTAPSSRLSGTVANATMTLTFSEAMDTSTVTTDNVSLTCGGSAQTVTIAAATDSDSISDNEFTLTPSSALSQYSSCSVSVTTDVKDSAGNGLSAAGSYAFNTKCSTNDDFSNSATFSLGDVASVGGGEYADACWSITNHTSFASNDELAISSGNLAFDGPSSTDYEGNGDFIRIYKSFTSTNLTVTILIDSISGITGNSDAFSVMLIDDSARNFRAELNYAMGDTECNILSSSAIGSSTTNCSGSGIDALRVVKEGTSFTGYYSLSSSDDFVSLGTHTVSFDTNYTVGVRYDGDAGNGGNNQVSISSFTVSDATASDQD